MDERANQYFDDLVEGNSPDSEDDSVLSIDELLEMKQIPHQESSCIDSTEYMAPVAKPDDTTMLVRLAPFATQDNATTATEQPSVDPNIETSLANQDAEPFIDPSEYASMDEEEDHSKDFEIGFSFDAADTIPYEDDGVYIPLEVVTAYKNGVAPSSRIVDNTPIGSDQEVGSLNNSAARIANATNMDVDQVGADMAAELEKVLSNKASVAPYEESNSLVEDEAQPAQEQAPEAPLSSVAPSFQLNQIFAGEKSPEQTSDEMGNPKLSEETDPFVESQKKTADQIQATDKLPAIGSAPTPSVSAKDTSKKHKTGAIEGSKAPNHFGPRTYDPKLEQKPFEYKFDKKKKKKKGSFFKDLISYIVIIALAWVAAKLLTTYVLINAIIPSGSMTPTINQDDRIFGFRLSYLGSEPKRGDIIIFPAPDEPQKDYIKRIIGLPGETITADKGVITITHKDGSTEVLKEDYLAEPWSVFNTFGPIVIPDDGYFCMGDNRNTSNDARYWKNKFVSRDSIRAKALLRYWPFQSFGIVK